MPEPHLHPVSTPVPGSPFQPGEIVLVTDAVDRDVHDVSGYVGRLGVVGYLEYDCGCGQHFPDDPMVGVRFAGGDVMDFWPEELRRSEAPCAG